MSLTVDSSETGGWCFPVETIRRLAVNKDSALIDDCIKNKEPIVITGTELVASAVQRWSLDYLAANLSSQFKCNVVKSTSTRFKYWDEKRLGHVQSFNKPTEHIEMLFAEFVDIIKKSSPSDKHHFYLQQLLTDRVGERITADFKLFNWRWVNERQQRHAWGELTSNMLFITQPGNSTPCHYDEQENMFAQVRSAKRCVLFSPDMFDCLYTHPVCHPCDRQSQIDLEAETQDFRTYPKLRDLRGHEAVVAPGEVLYIPAYWFHFIKSQPDDTEPVNISVNFWYKAASLTADDVKLPLRPDQKIAMTRNVEKMITTALGDANEVASFFSSLTLGRYAKPPQ